MVTPDFVHEQRAGSRSSDVVLVLLHGTGGNEHDLIPLAHELMPEAGILSLRGRVMENGMPRFFRRHAEGVFDLDDLKLQTTALMDFLQVARERYHLAKHKCVAVGYSNGANIASSLMLTYSNALAGAVLFRGMVPFEPQTSPDLTGLPVLLRSGQRDPIVPRSNAEKLAEIFSDAGANIKHSWYPGGHELGQSDIDTAKTWLLVELT